MNDRQSAWTIRPGTVRGWLLPILFVFAAVVIVIWAVGRLRPGLPSDHEMRAIAAAHGVMALAPAPSNEDPVVELGRSLFFDPVLSGRRDVSCATCHHPRYGTSDGLSVSIGTGSSGIGPDREFGEGSLAARNAPDLFNRGHPDWTSMFWDLRIAVDDEGGLVSPAGKDLPAGLDGVLAAQAMFPVTWPEGMRGERGTEDILGGHNEIADALEEDLPAVWDAIMERLLGIPRYRELFAVAYPETPPDELGFEHAANAIAAFQIDAFTLTGSPFNQWLEGDDTALTEEQKRGASLFFGSAGCVACHAGPLLTDQIAHNIATPQAGPGMLPEAPEDHGWARTTGDPADTYRFRTPSLHNVAVTGPWGHAGTFDSLDAVVRHHVDPAESLTGYGGRTSGPGIEIVGHEAFLEKLVADIDPLLQVPELTDEEIAALVAFLDSMTDPAVDQLEGLIPDAVPSGLTVPR